MQNKGFVKVFAVLLTLVCLFYLSFSVVTNHYENKAAALAQTEGQATADRYLDSLLNNKVYLNVKPEAMFAELHRLGMPDESTPGFSKKNFISYFGIK